MATTPNILCRGRSIAYTLSQRNALSYFQLQDRVHTFAVEAHKRGHPQINYNAPHIRGLPQQDNRVVLPISLTTKFYYGDVDTISVEEYLKSYSNFKFLKDLNSLKCIEQSEHFRFNQSVPKEYNNFIYLFIPMA
ncbi:hypothetical protein Bhyg_06200 [Pseudolycoriella hygida]|uniref:Uncharacterized protein n=1 Tax=Pseudolycoriella hygida TaxID=35572 RepID=A0A9Q0S2Q1_9DIPT|nr:hypothetical protein Bhyg_06200 [Pseudolycoriella hygida]